METLTFVAVAVFILAFGLVSARLSKTVITPPMVFVGFGILMGPAGLGLMHLSVESEIVRALAEATLVLVLFTDASRIDLRLLRRSYHLPLRMLAIGLPLTMALGTIGAVALFGGLSLWGAAIAAAILAPTDAALGQAVVSNPRVPARIRQALNVESGLNDGIALPFVLFFIHGAHMGDHSHSFGYWAEFVTLQLVLGPLVGAAVGYGGGRIVDWGTRAGWMNHSFQQLSAIALALLAFAGAETVGGNGFIAAFVAGLVLGNTAKSICTCLIDFAEAEGQLLALLAFMVFGAAEIGPALTGLGSTVLIYAVLSLTVIRMLPISLSLIGSGLRAGTHLFLGWFGPRGLASILYVFLVLEGQDVAGREQIFTLVMMTVLLSVFAHGLSAWPFSNAYARQAEKLREQQPEGAEHGVVEEIPVRLRLHL